MKRYNVKIEFGKISCDYFDVKKPLISTSIVAYSIEELINQFDNVSFQNKCRDTLPSDSTFGMHRIIFGLNHENLGICAKKAEKDGGCVFFQSTDHDGYQDYYVRMVTTVETRKEIVRNLGLKTWWRFGIASRKVSEDVVQYGWNYLFGNIYFNKGELE